ncbi:hypothetical protein EDB83DRAFT_803431 [Lactarius deliciosus]|nr:hypothetical protein EDB83DRAFT_803431 [Lactarius deliciosus]
MDFRYQSTSWSLGDFEVDVFANLSTICADGLQDHTLLATSSAGAVQNRRRSSPSPTPACIDPKLTVLWPSRDMSPGADRTPADGDDAGWAEDSARARVPDMPGTAQSPTSKERKRRSTVATQVTSRNSRAADKGHTKWKYRAEGGDNLSGPPTYTSKVGSHADPGPTGRGEGRKTEGIERVHTKLWKCRIGGCNKTFHRKGDAMRHLQTTAKHNGKSVVCNCGATFSRHDALKRHQRLCHRHARELL